MESLRSSIRKLNTLLISNITRQEDKEIRAEIDILKKEYMVLEARQSEISLGISSYGSYFTS